MDEIKKIQSDLELEKLKTQLKKEQFVKQIKSGLGEHIKNNGGKVNVIKKSRFKKFWEKVLRIF
jgi:flagellar basal body-associated protein FliL